jgi:hypothetical protein
MGELDETSGDEGAWRECNIFKFKRVSFEMSRQDLWGISFGEIAVFKLLDCPLREFLLCK